MGIKIKEIKYQDDTHWNLEFQNQTSKNSDLGGKEMDEGKKIKLYI
jgi:hypothetical protein